MQNKAFYIVSICIVVLVTLGAVYYFTYSADDNEPQITSYDQCAAAGYPIQETYPQRCTTPDGQVFVQAIQVTNFDSCVASGGMVASNNSGPQTCKTDDGSVYYDGYMSYISEKGVLILISQPEKNASVSSPVVVKGRVPGNWSFEASFPVIIQDANGIKIGSSPAQLKGDWMTDEYVDFEASISYSGVSTGTNGMLILQKDNPSGLPEKEDKVSFPILLN